MKSAGWPRHGIRPHRDRPRGAPVWPAPGQILSSFGRVLKSEIAVSPAASASALLALAGGAVFALALIAANEYGAADEARAARADLLASMEGARSAASRTVLARNDAPSDNPYAAGATETLAAAQIDRILRRIVVEAGGVMLSSRIEAKREDGRQTRRIEAEITLEGGVDTIQSALYGVETSTPFLFVEALSIHPADAAKADGAEAPLLRASAIVSAFWKGPP